ncbi:MAG: hypothetical protein Q4G19_06365 [Clostridia bacterium]|nr:hypothetical protein [Clostridia bacterium]
MFTITKLNDSEDVTLTFFSGFLVQNGELTGENEICKKVLKLDSYEKMMMDAAHRIIYLAEHNNINASKLIQKVQEILLP